MQFAALLLFIPTVLLAQTTSAPEPDVQFLKDTKVTEEIVKVLKGVTLYGSNFLPDIHCNSATVENPQKLEVFRIEGKEATVVLCPGALDGDENVVTIFSKSQLPSVSKVKPPAGSARITDQQLKDSFVRVAMKPAAPSEGLDVRKIKTSEYDACMKNQKKKGAGSYVGESFPKSRRGLFDSMTLYACVAGDEMFFNPENRIQLDYVGVKLSWLTSNCGEKRTLDLPAVVPASQVSFTMVVKCGLASSLLTTPGQ